MPISDRPWTAHKSTTGHRGEAILRAKDPDDILGEIIADVETMEDAEFIAKMSNSSGGDEVNRYLVRYADLAINELKLCCSLLQRYIDGDIEDEDETQERIESANGVANRLRKYL